MFWPKLVVLIATGLCAVAAGCGDDHDDWSSGTPDNAGQACTAPAQCYANLEDAGALQGEVVCMDRVEGGYCTHRCQTDADCCAVPGECWSNLLQVCAPFESTGEMYCFLSCEDRKSTRLNSSHLKLSRMPSSA